MSKTFLLHLIIRVFSRLRLRTVHRLGGAIGWLLAVVPNRRLHTTLVNLALCFPELSRRRIYRLARQHLVEYGKTFAESAFLWTRQREEVQSLVRDVQGEEQLRRALAPGKRGVIIAMPHLGSWELVNLYCSMRYPVTTLYGTPRLGGLDRSMRKGREQLGARLVPADASGVRMLYQALGRGEMVLILPDQIPAGKQGGAYAPFFGIPAHTPTLLSRLAIKTGAPVFMVYAERLDRGGGYRLRFARAPDEIGQHPMETSVASMNRKIEELVRLIPAHYQWCYKRFRNKPGAGPCYYALGPKAAFSRQVRHGTLRT